MKKTTGCWLILAFTTVAIAAGMLYFQVSWGNPYSEAEALHPLTVEFALDLSAVAEARSVSMDDIHALLKKEHYADLRSRSFTPPDNPPRELLKMRVNRRFGFSLHRDGWVTWIDYKR